MEIPSTLKVGPYSYTVSTDATHVKEMQRDHPGWNGMTDFHFQRIVLDDTVALDTLAEVLWHEVKHVIDFAAGLGVEESVTAHENIYRTSAWVLLVLRDNPDLIAFLAGGRG